MGYDLTTEEGVKRFGSYINTGIDTVSSSLDKIKNIGAGSDNKLSDRPNSETFLTNISKPIDDNLLFAGVVIAVIYVLLR